ncbi:uncharacterized protein LOC141627729 [Silene latifolia]|uniref:uncharacterized protein LOC141627729 n=1 Tax=Silene latifolia TaxID=37657 RepID=UPI003D7756B5
MTFKSWKAVCAPWKEGGFGLKELLSWNKAMLLQWVWKLGSTDDSFWVTWIQSYPFKGIDVWHTPIKESFPDSLKGILKVRDACIQLAGGIQQAQLLVQTCVHQGRFIISKGYELFRTRHPAVPWAEPISRHVIVPAHRITISLALEAHLPTVDNVIGKGLIMPNRCSLCRADAESHGQLFFHCAYAKVVWQALLTWIGINRRGMTLKQEIGWIKSRKHRKHWSANWFICTLAAAVHFLWHERNQRIFTSQERSPEILVQQIKYIVGVGLLAFSKDSIYNTLVEHLAR